MLTTILRRLALTALVFLAWAPAAHAWTWPVHGPVLHPFVYDEAHPYASGQHRGIDIGGDAAAETVVAPAAGTVSFAGTVPTNGESVTIETSDGYAVTLTHLGSILVPKGAAVAEGDSVGTIGPSGTPEVDGPYVHLGIRVAADANGYVDPLGLLPAPTAESPPAESAAPPPQPTASAATSAPPATEPAPVPTGSTPSATTRGSTVQPGQGRSSPHERGRAQEPRENARPRPSSRPRALHPSQPARRVRHAVRTPHREASEPAQSFRRPIFEPASSREPPVLAGVEIPPNAEAAQPQEPRIPLPIVLNGAAALVALAAAFAAARRRARPSPAVQILELPRPAFEHRRTA